MTKSELVHELAGKLSLTQSVSADAVNAVFDVIKDALCKGDSITIRGFGTFSVKEYKSHNGRNPKTGEPIVIEDRKLPFFKCGKELRELVNGK